MEQWKTMMGKWLRVLCVLVVLLAGNGWAQPAATAEAISAAQGPAPAAAAWSGASSTSLPASAPVLQHPALVPADSANGADTAWVMTCTALVMLMTLPGIALFYGGMVRTKNVLNTMASVLAIAAMVSVLWFALVYSLAFTPANSWIGGLQRAGFSGFDYVKQGAVAASHIAPHLPESVYAMFQLAFAVITAALVAGAYAERMRFGAVLVFTALWTILVYAPVAHWVWEPGGWLARIGVLDFAGGTVVHVNAGATGLVLAAMLGKRTGFGKEALTPFNLGLTMAGTGMLWVGWFGFNAGSALAADGRAGLALLVTHLAAASGALAWMLAEWLSRQTPSLLGLCSGAVAGLVAITPAAGYVDAAAAPVFGGLAGVCCYWGATRLKAWLKVDDALDVFGVHAVGGVVGALLTAVFNNPAISGVQASVSLQALAVVAVLAYSAVMTAVLAWVVRVALGSLRVSDRDEYYGLDLAVHRERIA